MTNHIYCFSRSATFKGWGTLKFHSYSKTGWFYGYFLANISNGGTAPLIPLFLVLAFSGTLTQVGLVTAATSIASIPAYIIWGNLSDHLHRRKLFILEGLAGLAVSMALMWLSVNFFMFLIANFLLGLLYAASAPAGTALLIEQTPKEQWASCLGKFSKLGGAGYLTGLVAGAVWFSFVPSTQVDMRFFFAFSVLSALAGTALILLLVNEKTGEEINPPGHRRDSHWNAIAAVPLHLVERAKYLPSRMGAFVRLATPSQQERKEIPAGLWKYYAVVALFSTGFTSFYAVLPNYMADYLGTRFLVPESLIFLVYIGSSIASTLTYSRVSSISAAAGEKRLQSLALSARVLIIPSFFLPALFINNAGEVMLFLLILNSMMGVCWAIISVTGQSMVAKMAGPHIKGEAIGFYNAFTGIGAIAGAIAGGIVAQDAGYMSDFLLSSLFIASGITLLSALKMDSESSSGDSAEGKPGRARLEKAFQMKSR